MPQVKVIHPIPEQAPRLRVAAYARVSSDSDDQLNSLAVQIDYYTALIQSNPDWDFVGIYADEGITGTSTKKRAQFNRLMDDCRAGLIDRILVKSASRFARNTVDGLAAVRELRQIGVTVAFEKEAFDTGDAHGEMLLSMIYAVAQEESISISKNLKWGIEKRMRAGTYDNGSAPYGYANMGHQLVPDKQAGTNVKMLFERFLNGASLAMLAAIMNQEAPKSSGCWRASDIEHILTNEKYAGNTLLQKRFTTDSLPLTRCKNNGELPQYFISHSHQAIVTQETFAKAQNLLLKKRTSNWKKVRPARFSNMLFCPLCGSPLLLKPAHRWICRTHWQSAEKCPTMPVQEAELCRAFLYVYSKLLANKDTILHPMLNDLERLQRCNASDAAKPQQNLLTLAKRKRNLARLHAQEIISGEQYWERCTELDRQIAQEKASLTKECPNRAVFEAIRQTKLLIQVLADPDIPTEFSGEKFQQTVQKVVVDNESFTFTFMNGLTIRHARES